MSCFTQWLTGYRGETDSVNGVKSLHFSNEIEKTNGNRGYKNQLLHA
jgi:hypothetical protein